jgi:hypothetical protein
MSRGHWKNGANIPARCRAATDLPSAKPRICGLQQSGRSTRGVPAAASPACAFSLVLPISLSVIILRFIHIVLYVTE